MTGNRKSFLLHIDSLDILDELTDEECGLLFKAIKAHQQGVEVELNGLVRVAFSPFRNQFNRDDEKYDLTCKRRADAGSKGGKQKVANASKSKQKVANLADSVSKSDNDSDSDSYLNPLVEPKAKQKKAKFNEYQMDFAKWMFSLIIKLNPNNKEPNFETWASTIRLMMDADKRDGDLMVKVFTWANKDSFWCSNILSPSKLRDKFDDLVVKMNNGGGSNQTPQERTQAETDQFTAELNDQYERSQAAKARREARTKV